MDSGGVSLICSLLHKNISVLEFGSGGSTTFFRLWFSIVQDTIATKTKLLDYFCLVLWISPTSEYVSSWVSVEHDVRWAKRVRSILAKLPWGDKVGMNIISVGLVKYKSKLP